VLVQLPAPSQLSFTVQYKLSLQVAPAALLVQLVADTPGLQL
jgi:hypothetical protein